MRRKRLRAFCLGVGVAVLPLYLGACMFPTLDDFNRGADAERKHVAGEHDATRQLMTEQHKIQTPEQSALLAQVNADAVVAIEKLREEVAAVKAEGIMGGLGGNGTISAALAALLGLGALGTVVTRKQTALELKLATAAKAGEQVPSDAPT